MITYCFGTSGGCLDSFFLDKELNPKDKRYFLSDDHKIREKLYGSEVIGPFKEIGNLSQKKAYFIYQCGSILNHKKRDIWFNKAVKSGIRPKSLISKYASIAKSAIIGEGSIIYPGVVIMRDVILGKNTIVLPNSVINHDSSVGDFSIINSSCTINGNVNIGKLCYIGSNSSIIESTIIKNKITVGMNSMILCDLVNEGLYFGCPAKFIKEKI